MTLSCPGPPAARAMRPLGVLYTYARQPFYHLACLLACLSPNRPGKIPLARRQYRMTCEDPRPRGFASLALAEPQARAAYSRSSDSHLHDFGFLCAQRGIDLADEAVRHFLDFAFVTLFVVLADRLILEQFFNDVETIAADMADRDARVFGVFMRDLRHFLAPLLVEFRNPDPQDLTFDRRGEAQIRIADGFVDGGD